MLKDLVPVQEADHGVVDEQQRRRPDDPAGHRVVVADDRVLDGVRQSQQNDQVERVELRQLALAGQPETDDQERVDQDGAQDLLEHGQAEVEHVAHG